MIFLSAIDWIMLLLLLVSTLISIKRGFVKEGFSLATWVAAVIVSRLFARQLSTLLVDYIELSSLRLGTAYVLLIVGTLMVGAMINHLIGEFVLKVGLSGMDKFIGMFFGFARGCVILIVLIAGLYYLAPVAEDNWWSQSVFIPHIVDAVEWLGPLLWEQSERLIEFAKEKVI